MNDANRIWGNDVVPWICDMSMTVSLMFLLSWNMVIGVVIWLEVITVRDRRVSQKDGWRDIQRDWQLIITRRLDESFIERDESVSIKEMEWHFGESWWLCSSEWIDDANESLILANVGFGRCSNGLTVDLCRSAEREFHQKRSKWLYQEYVNWWDKAEWWFMVTSWK